MFGPGKYLFRGKMSSEDKHNCKPSPKPGRNMLSAFTYYADYSMPIPELPGNIVIKDCMFKNVDRFLHYNFSGNETWQRHRPMSDITFENIKAEGVGMALNAYGREDSPLELTLKNIDISVREDSEVTELIKSAHCKRITLENLKLENFIGDCIVRTLTDVNVVSDNVIALLEKSDFVKKHYEDFKIKSI